MMRFGILILLLITALPTGECGAQTLWHGLDYGMKEGEIRHIFPNARNQQKTITSPSRPGGFRYDEFSVDNYRIDDCLFDIKFDMGSNNSLFGIIMEISDASASSVSCRVSVQDGLSQKYGKPNYIHYDTFLNQKYWDLKSGVRVSFTWYADSPYLRKWGGQIGYFRIPNQKFKNSL
ncbi:hypothetical protein [Gluconobacter oxydans]|uniref:hypothetical protein n=1 Tax=Gluconobacter oxydans TaxID=442 RepID=UPI0039E7302B